MCGNNISDIRKQPRFNGIFENGSGFERRIYLNTHMNADDLLLAQQAIQNVDDISYVTKLEERLSTYVDGAYVIATNSGISAMHMAIKLAAKKAYGTDDLSGKRVFCCDLGPVEQAMPILYENGIPTFIDITDIDYNMDPESLETAFGIYPDTKIVIMNHLYGFPGQILAVKRICEEHGAILIENASEAFGAKIDGKPAGTIGEIAVFDFGDDKIVAGEKGGALVTRDENDSVQVRKWVTLSRNNLPWNHTETIGYDYQMSEISAAIILGQLNYLGEILDRKKQIYDIYQEHLNDELLYLIGSDENAEPNYWHSTVFIDSQIEADEKYTEDGYSYEDIHGTTSPMEVVDSLEAFGADAAPVYMPLSLQPAFSGSKLIGADGIIEVPKAYADDDRMFRDECSGDAFKRCVCLPADPSMTKEEQLKVIEIVHACFNKQNIDLGAFDAFE